MLFVLIKPRINKKPAFGGVFLFVYIYIRMKGYLVYTFLFLVLAFHSGAQRDSLARHERFLISTSFGTATPIREFSSYNDVLDAGPPKRGVSYKGEFMYSPCKYFGIMGSYIRTLNETPALNGYTFYPKSGLGAINTGKQISSFYYWADNWITDNALVGISGRYLFWGLWIRAKAMVGWQWVKAPEVRISAEGWEQSASGMTWWSRSTIDEAMKGQALVYNGGIDIRANIVKGFGIMTGIDFLNTVVNLKNNLHNVQKNVTYRTWMFGLTYSFR